MKKFIARMRRDNVNALGLCSSPKQLELLTNGKVLLFAPHPDDEVLGCGGTLALLQRNNCAIKVVIVTDGAGAGTLPPSAVLDRQNESIAALETLGVKDVVFWDEPDGSFQDSKAFGRKAQNLLHEFAPDWLFMPSVLDYHRDHVAIGAALLKWWQKSGIKARGFIYEVWCPLPASVVVDIGSVFDLKKVAISCYRIPLQHCDYLSASVGLAASRGLFLEGGKGGVAEVFLEVENTKASMRTILGLLRFRFALEEQLNS